MKYNQFKTAEDLLATSMLWDNNPKLIQVLNQIDFSYITQIDKTKRFQKTNQPKGEAYFSDLFSGLTEAQIKALFHQSNHWFNQSEIAFITQSWLQRQSHIAVLTRKMNEATRLSQANANAYRAQQLNKTNPTLALRLAERNYTLFPESKAAASSFASIISEIENIKYRIEIPANDGAIVYAIAISPCGTNIITGDEKGRVYRWDMEGKLLQQFQPHQSYVNSLAFLPDSPLPKQQILTGSKDKTAKLLDLVGNELEQLNKKHKASIYKAIFSPKKDKIITTDTLGIVKIWAINGHFSQAFRAHKKPIYDIAIAPSGKYLLTASKDKTAKLWDLEKLAEPLHIFTAHQYEVSAVAFSNELEQPKILTGSWDTTIKLWNWEGQLLHTFNGHKDDIRAVIFSPNNQYILSAGKEGIAKLWDISGKLIANLKGHTQEIHEIAFTPDGKSMATGSGDGTVKIWDLPVLTTPAIEKPKREVSRIFFSEKEQEILTTANGKQIQVWNLDGQLKGVFQPEKIETTSKGKKTKSVPLLLNTSDFAPPQRPTFLKHTKEKLLTLWNSDILIRPHKKGRDPAAHPDSIATIVFSANKEQALIGYWDDSIQLWNLKEQSLSTFPATATKQEHKHKEKIIAAVFSVDGQFILTGSQDETAKLWTKTGEFIQSFPHNKKVLASFSNNRKPFSEPPYPARRATRGKNFVHAVTFQPNQKKEEKAIQIATGCKDGIARLWDINAHLMQTVEGHSAAITTLTFSPDGQYLLTGSADLTVKIWDLTGNEIQYYEGHKDPVFAIRFLPDKQSFLTYSKDKIAQHLLPDYYLENKVALCEDDELQYYGIN